MREILADDRRQTRHKIRSFAGTGKSGKEKAPAWGGEGRGSRGRKETRGSGENVSVQSLLNTFREERDVIQVTFLRVPRATLTSLEAVHCSKVDADDPTLIDRVELAVA